MVTNKYVVQLRTAILDTVSVENRRDRLVPFSSKLAFGVGQLAEGLQNTAFGLFVLFYYNQVLGLSGTLAGLALAIALLFNAVADPLVGSLSSNWKSRLGRRHPFLYVFALLLALAFAGLFGPPSDVQALGEWGLFAWLTLLAICTHGALMLWRGPHLALGAEMTRNDSERNRLIAYRQCFGILGVATVWLAGFGFFFSDARGGNLAVANYAPFAITLGLLMAATMGYSAWGTRKEGPFLSDSDAVSKPQRGAFVRPFLDLCASFASRSFTWLLAGVFVLFVMVGVSSVLDLYMLQYFWELRDGEKLGLGMAFVAGLAGGVLLAVPLLPVIGKRGGMLLGTAVCAVCQVVPVVMRMLDWLPGNGTAELFITLFAFKCVQGLILQLAFVAFGAMLADVADEHEYRVGVRREGIFYGAAAFCAKATAGMGMLLGGVGLDSIDWPHGAATDVPVDDLGLFYGPVVAGCSVVALWCYTRYNLSRKRHAEIVTALNARRQAVEGRGHSLP